MENSKKQYKKQMYLSFILFLSELPNFIIVITLAIKTQSLVVLTDLIDSAGNLFRALFMFLLVRKLTKDLRYKYNYGVGKVEAVASVCFDMLMLVSIGSMFVFAVRDIITPKQPSDAMGFAVIFKVFCVAGDAFMFFKQRKLCKASDSLMLKSELAMRIKNLAFDSSTLIAVLLIYVCRNNPATWYFSPIVCILLTLWLAFGIIRRMRHAIREILDKTADENVQKAVLHELAANIDKYEAFESVNSRVSGETTYIDLHLGFREDMRYSEIEDLVGDIYNGVAEKLPNCRVSVVITNRVPEQSDDGDDSDFITKFLEKRKEKRRKKKEKVYEKAEP